MNVWWIQAIGVAALLLDIFSVQFKARRQILGVGIAASVAWVTHFLLLGAFAGAAMNSIGVVRSVGYYKFRNSRHSLWLPVSVIGLSCIMTAVTWQGIVSLLPMLAMVVAAIAFWQQDEQRLRQLLLFAVPLWFMYNFIFHSYAGMLSDSLALLSTTLALYRYRHHALGYLHKCAA